MQYVISWGQYDGPVGILDTEMKQTKISFTLYLIWSSHTLENWVTPVPITEWSGKQSN